MKKILSDLFVGLVLALMIFVIAGVSFKAHAQSFAQAPNCNAFTEGVGHVFGYTETPALAAVHWWCPAENEWGQWRSSRAVLDLTVANKAAIFGMLSARDMQGLILARTIRDDAAVFDSVFAQMAPAIAKSRPPGPWVVAKNGSYPDRPMSRLFNGVITQTANLRVTPGTLCDCLAGRFISGATTYCQVGANLENLAVCTRP